MKSLRADFKNAYLKNAYLSYHTLTYADFTNADLEGVTFSHSNLYGAIGMDLSNVSSVCDAILRMRSVNEDEYVVLTFYSRTPADPI